MPAHPGRTFEPGSLFDSLTLGTHAQLERRPHARAQLLVGAWGLAGVCPASGGAQIGRGAGSRVSQGLLAAGVDWAVCMCVQVGSERARVTVKQAFTSILWALLWASPA